MSRSEYRDDATEAARAARRARIMSALWWIQVPIVSIVYWFISTEPVIEKLILVYLADVSIVANAVTYSSKSQAAVAGYENP